jgi:hypothetical protein
MDLGMQLDMTWENKGENAAADFGVSGVWAMGSSKEDLGGFETQLLVLASDISE